ncbi:hypothetical protein BH23GEM9_BH23GEM9_08150 [soil metagenome]
MRLSRAVLPALLTSSALALPAALQAQHIAIKTVPVPTGEQFSIFPSLTMGMADVHVAVDDPMMDPFWNPSRGALANQLLLYALPTFYGETNDWVAGRSLPLAAVIPGRRFFGAAAFALQQLGDTRRTGIWVPMPGGSNIRDNSSSNVYVFGAVGARLTGRTSIGISAYRADLEAVDGVNMLYGNSSAIEQSGDLTEFRIGGLHEFGADRRLDAIVLTSRTDMKHDVHYVDWTDWSAPVSWSELNEDRTITWAAQLRYTQPVVETARLGLMIAGNTKAHPKIPNYNIVNIPRDPGNSAMFNIGVGISNAAGPAIVGAEVIYEPGRSHTWAYADSAITTPTGSIPAGGRTIDNQFRFSNWSVGVGAQWESERVGLQAGLRLHETRYTLDQENFLTATRRDTRESWMEWAPSWSGVVKLSEFDLRYTGRFSANGWPQNQWGWGFGFVSAERTMSTPGGIDFVVGPTGEVWLPEYRVTTHRFTLSVPFGR